MKDSHRHSNNFHVFLCKTEYYKLHLHTSFLSRIINEWNKFDSNIRSYYLEYCNVLLKFIGPAVRKIYNVDDYNGLKKFTGI